MPISPPAAGTDPASIPSGGRAGLTLDYHGPDRGPSFRQALAQAAIPDQPTPLAPPAIAAPARQLAGAPAGDIYEGADALSQLRRDLVSGGGALIEAPAPDAPASDDEAVVETAAAQTAIAAATAPDDATAPADWRHDDVEGRRLGDRAVPPAEGSDGVETWLFGEDGFGFDDLIDVINPLQHIPIVSSIYRWITGDDISPAANVAGGALFGGPLGLTGAVASVAIEEATGDDLGGHVMAMMFGEGTAPDQSAPVGDLAAMPAAEQLAAGQQGLPATTLPARAGPVPFIPAPSGPAPQNPVEAPSAVDAAIAAQMKLALDKYEALTRQRAAETASANGALAVPASGSLYDGRL